LRSKARFPFSHQHELWVPHPIAHFAIGWETSKVNPNAVILSKAKDPHEQRSCEALRSKAASLHAQPGRIVSTDEKLPLKLSPMMRIDRRSSHFGPK
jgi:hypothetical protein